MKNIGRALGTMAVWGGIAGLCWMFNSFGFFNASGAAGMVIVGGLATGGIWNSN